MSALRQPRDQTRHRANETAASQRRARHGAGSPMVMSRMWLGFPHARLPAARRYRPRSRFARLRFVAKDAFACPDYTGAPSASRLGDGIEHATIFRLPSLHQGPRAIPGRSSSPLHSLRATFSPNGRGLSAFSHRIKKVARPGISRHSGRRGPPRQIEQGEFPLLLQQWMNNQ